MIIYAQIDLSSAQLIQDDDHKFTGFKVNNDTKFHLSTNITHHLIKENKNYNVETAKLSDPTFLSGDFPSIYLENLIDKSISGYEESNYSERLTKAFTFLIENCGEGEFKPKPIDTGNKF